MILQLQSTHSDFYFIHIFLVNVALVKSRLQLDTCQNIVMHGEQHRYGSGIVTGLSGPFVRWRQVWRAEAACDC
jgi:hypothetical protein